MSKLVYHSFTVFLFLLVFSNLNLHAQYKITGFTPALAGIYYGPYTISGGTLSTGDHWCVTGGSINSTSNTCLNYNGTPSIGVTWNAGITSGTVSYYLNGSGTPIVTYAVCIPNNAINMSTLNAQFAPDSYPYVPSGKLFTLNLQATDASYCGPITYSWQVSIDGTNYTDAGSNTQNYSVNQAFTQTTFFRRGVRLDPYVNYTSAITVTPAPPITAGTITPAGVTIGAFTNPGTFTATTASGGTMCGGNYTYTWQTSTDNINWTNAGSGLTFAPGTISTKTYIRQLAICGPLAGATNPVIVDIFQPLNGGLISPGSVMILSNTSPGTITGSPATNGNVSAGYSYQWLSCSTIGGTYVPITGAPSGPSALNYTCPALTTETYIKRMVTCNGQSAYSNIVTIKIGTDITANYIQTRDITASNITTLTSADALTALSDVKQVNQFFDGLGRLSQTIAMKGSMVTGSAPTDIVSVSQYDQTGREVFKYLPYVSVNNNGIYKSNALPDQNAYNLSQFPSENYYYQQVNFETSSLDRINNTTAPGNSWTGSNKGVQMYYGSNSVIDLVRIWYVANGTIGTWGSYNTPGFYPTGTLYKIISTDENLKQTIEFKDKNGRIIFKKVQLTANADDGSGVGYEGWLCTYYIYDDLGNIRCVIQPHGVELLIQNGWNISALSSIILNEQCFRYEYDQRNRMIIEKTPGADAEYLVYDNLDRLVMTQDGNLRVAGKWLTTLYENNLDRPVQTGLYANSTAFSSILSAANISTAYPFSPASPGTYPTWEMLTQSHYDDYLSLPTGLGSTLNTSSITLNNFYTGASCNVSPTYALPLVQTSSGKNKGLLTWTKVEVYGSGTAQYISSVYIYDDRARKIQDQTLNYSGGLDLTTIQYDFTGKILISDLRHQKMTSGPTQTYELATRCNYDDLGRLIKTERMLMTAVIASPAWKTVSAMSYDGLGRVITKSFGNDPLYTGGGYKSLENYNYEYNVRGWLLGINRNYINSSSLTNYFGYELGYDKQNTIVPSTTYAVKQFNGNVAGTVWKNGSDLAIRKYDYTYDAVNRLATADFNQYNSIFNKGDGVDYSINNLFYDANGNITSMKLAGWKAGGSVVINDLTYNPIVNTNKLLNISDPLSDKTTSLGNFRYSPTYTTSLGGVAKTASTIDYAYDNNGNLTSDKNKDISSITYNYCNLPLIVSFGTKGSIVFTYDAQGNKLKKLVTDYTSGKTITTTSIYIAGFVYESRTTSPTDSNNPDYSDVLQYSMFEDGRIRPQFNNVSSPTTITGFTFDYFLKDNIENTRLTLTEEQQTDAYPTLGFEGTSSTDQTVINQDKTWDNSIGNPIGVLTSRVSPLPTGFNNGTHGSYCGSITKPQGAIGFAKLIKVMARDQISVSLMYTYSSAVVNNTGAGGLNTLLNSLAAMISGSSEVNNALHSSGTLIASGQNNSIVSGLFSTAGETPSSITTGPPKAYLHILFFNDQFLFDNINSIVIPITSAGLNAEAPLTRSMISIVKSGYAYIYFSNESNTVVYFDNFNLTHIRGPILESNSYYPYGLTMAGISQKAFGKIENKYKVTGKEIQHLEFADGSGLEEYDFGARGYDAQIGIWHSIDPHAAKYERFTPYGYAYDNPANNIDPNGKDYFLSGTAAQNFFRQFQQMNEHSIGVYDQIARFHAKENGGENGGNFEIKGVHPVYESITPETYAHIYDAINYKHYPQVLTRGFPKDTDPNRGQAMKEIPRTSRPLREPYIPLWRDEYPFASTVEGGFASSTAWVPGWEQEIQKSQIISLYSYIKPGEKFIVALIGKNEYDYTNAPAWYSLPYWNPSKLIIQRPGNFKPMPVSPPPFNNMPPALFYLTEVLELVPRLAIP